ncbi:hypothetical protein ABZ499_21790 [Streptomyces sp. NPDC019990]|uniref:hypothetical protein n=1 Tax=Streptomyces sp. NPDC019990 TaxID=3154693 RepID=UPI0034080B86
MTQQPLPPDVDLVLRHNRSTMVKHVAAQLALAIALIAIPFLLQFAGVSVSTLTVLPIVPGLFLLIFLYLRVGLGRRLKVCENVLRTYPLEYRSRVVKKQSQRLLLGDVHTVKLSVRGQHGAPSMRAVNVSTARRWPKDAENNGAWFAGDPAFGGVMIVPGNGDMFFLQPADWEKFASERAQAAPERREKAEQAGISQLLEKEPNPMAGLGN